MARQRSRAEERFYYVRRGSERVAPSDPCSIDVRPRPTDGAVCHFGGLNAQAPTSHLQPSPGSSTHLARSERNASQLSLLLRRYRARSRLDTSSSALTRDTALRELRTHRSIHSRRRLNSPARLVAHHVLCRQGRGRTEISTLPRAAAFSRVARFMKCLGYAAVASLKSDV